MYQIAVEKRGDAVLGFRVVETKYIPRLEKMGQVKKGPKFYKVSDARKYREFLESQNMSPVELEIIE